MPHPTTHSIGVLINGKLIRPGQNGADDPFKCIFLKDQFPILIQPSLKIVSGGSIDNNSVLP